METERKGQHGLMCFLGTFVHYFEQVLVEVALYIPAVYFIICVKRKSNVVKLFYIMP